MFLCTLATKWAKISSIYSKITKVGGMFRDFPAQNRDPCLGTLAEKSPIRAAHPPFTILREYPPPPPPGPASRTIKLVVQMYLSSYSFLPFGRSKRFEYYSITEIYHSFAERKESLSVDHVRRGFCRRRREYNVSRSPRYPALCIRHRCRLRDLRQSWSACTSTVSLGPVWWALDTCEGLPSSVRRSTGVPSVQYLSRFLREKAANLLKCEFKR